MKPSANHLRDATPELEAPVSNEAPLPPGRLDAVLGALVSIQDYQRANANVFPSRGSVEWFVRQHKLNLIEARAIYIITRRTLLHAQRFNAYVLKVGERR